MMIFLLEYSYFILSFNKTPSMRNRLFTFYIIILISPILLAQVDRDTSKVLMISIDGAADWILDDLLTNGDLSENGFFRQTKNKGMYAEEVYSAPVAATAVSHASIFTGAYPNRNGIVGNRFLEENKPMNRSSISSGFNASIKTQYLWEHLMNNRKKVVLVNSVGADGTSTSRRGSKTISYGKKLANAIHIQLEFGSEVVRPQEQIAYIPLKPENERSSMAFKVIGKKETIPLFAFIRKEEIKNLKSSSKVWIDLDNNPENGHLGVLELGKWTPLYFNVNGQSVVSWSYLKNWDTKDNSITVYLGSIGSNPIIPYSFKNNIEKSVGLWPGEQDNRMLSRGLISETMWLEQAERLAYFYKDLILFNIREKNWDLLTGYFQLIDDVQHRFLLKNSRQLDFEMENGERKQRYDSYIVWAYRLVDELLVELQRALPKNVNLVVASDHGMAPVHSIFLINNFLKEANFNVKGENVEVKAINTGPAAHIYVNLQDRQQNGIVRFNQLQSYKKQIVKLLKKVKDPITGKRIFSVVIPYERLNRYKLNYPGRSGDVFVSAKSGWSLSSKINPDVPIVIPNTFNPDDFKNFSRSEVEFLKGGFMNETGLGVHGNLGTLREMHSIFYAIGPDIPTQKVSRMEIIDIAPTIMNIFQLPEIQIFDGKSVLKSLNRE